MLLWTEKVCVFNKCGWSQNPYSCLKSAGVDDSVVMPRQRTPPWWRRTIHCVYFHYKWHENDTRPAHDNHTHLYQADLPYIDILPVHVGVRLPELINPERHDLLYVFQVLSALHVLFLKCFMGQTLLSAHFAIWPDRVRHSRIRSWINAIISGRKCKHVLEAMWTMNVVFPFIMWVPPFFTILTHTALTLHFEIRASST